jgi:quercetin dioxygenase-like cupin family protein
MSKQGNPRRPVVVRGDEGAFTHEGDARRPRVVPAGAGDTYRWLGSLTTIRLSNEETGGKLAVLYVVAPASLEMPLHIHRNEDETFVLLEGSATFRIGEILLTAGPGDLVFGPRNIAHGYIVGSEILRMVNVLTPGGFEGFIRETGTPRKKDAQFLKLEDVDFEVSVSLAAAYGVDFIKG